MVISNALRKTRTRLGPSSSVDSRRPRYFHFDVAAGALLWTKFGTGSLKTGKVEASETQKKNLFLRFFLRNLFLRRAWGTLDSGIAVQSYTGIQMLIIWTVGLQSNPTQAYKCGSVELWDCSP